MKYIQNITLDISCSPTYQIINAKQCDNLSRCLNITLTSNGQQIKPESGVKAVFRCLKPDGNSCINPATINTDGTITVEFTKQELAVKGITLADISLLKNETILSTVSFSILVDKAPISLNISDSRSEFLILLDTIKVAETAADNANKAADKAKNATDAAVVAKQDADSSTAAANNAANLANTAKIEAEKAARNANIAADSATTAANSVEEAKQNANIAANNANSAAERIENAIKATDESTAKADTATENANAAASAVQTLTAALTEKLENGDFIGAQGKQGIQGEKGEDGFSPTVSIAPLDNGHTVSITDIDGEKSFNVLDGKQGVPGNDYILTDEDKKEIADLAVDNAGQAADKANAAAQAAQDVINYVNQKLADGDFNGADYILTAADKTEIAKLVTPLAESMQGGTVTYEIPKEYYEGEFLAFDRNNTTDPNKTGINVYLPSVAFKLGKLVLDGARFEEDLSSGLIEEPSDEIFQLPLDEQVPILEELYKNYMTISQNPWCPKTIKPLMYYALANTQIMTLPQVFRNSIETRIVIKREDSEERTIVVANPNFTNADSTGFINCFYPLITVNSTVADNSQIIELSLFILGNCPKYASDSRYATADDTIEEVTFMFIPNNTFVEADNNESV